jgi:hypothetical protein
MKKRSSLKTRMCELFPLVVSRITTPVHNPCHNHKIKTGIISTGVCSGIKTEACLDCVCLR